MTARWWMLVWLAASGCAQLLALDQVHAHDAAVGPLDAASAMDGTAPRDAPMTRCTSGAMLQLTPLADTFLDSVLAGTSFGSSDGLAVSASRTTLLIFPIAPAQIQAATLSLSVRASSSICGVSPCSPCSPGSGDMHMFWTRVDWDEATANYTQRAVGAPWDGAGATGAADRSSGVITTISFGGSSTSAVEVNATPQVNDLQPAWGTGALGIELAADSTTGSVVATFDSRESVVDTQCGAGTAPTLTVTCK